MKRTGDFTQKERKERIRDIASLFKKHETKKLAC
jgi:hypothetical protein